MRIASARYLDACAARAAQAEDPKWLQQFRPDRAESQGPQSSVTDLPDEEIEDYLNSLGFTLERE